MGKASDLFVQERQGLGERIADELRQYVPKIAPADAGAVGGPDLPRSGGGAAEEEVLQALGGGGEAASSGGESALLQGSLEGDADQGAVSGEILRRNADK